MQASLWHVIDDLNGTTGTSSTGSNGADDEVEEDDDVATSLEQKLAG
jgi:hypothetical protein